MENLDLHISLDEMKALFKRQEERYSTGRDISKSYLVFLAAMLSIVFSITSLKNPELFTRPSILICLGILVIILMLLTYNLIVLVRPTKFSGPIKPTREVIEKYYFDKDDRCVLAQIISSYVNVIEMNESEILKRDKIVERGGWLVILAVLAVITLFVIANLGI